MARKGIYASLIGELARLPGVGHKTAQRLAFAIMRLDERRVRRLGKTIIDACTQAHPCRQCNNLSSLDLCEICANPRRDTTRIMVVEDPGTLYQIEHTHGFRGLYHVLENTLSPLEGGGPTTLRTEGLLARIREGDVREVVIATSPTVEGEATALFLARELKPCGVAVSRIAYGVPVGMALEFADEVTLIKSIEGRRPM